MALVLRHVVRAIRARWPRVEILVRGDSHYARAQAMDSLERNRIGYVFGLAGNKVLLSRVVDHAEDAAMGRIEGEAEKVRRFAAFDYAARSWTPGAACPKRTPSPQPHNLRLTRPRRHTPTRPE